MSKRLALVLAAVLVGDVPLAFAQKVEASVNVGFSASEGITSDQRPLLGQQYNSIGPDSGASFNLTIGGLFGDHWGAEFLWSRQSSALQADGPAGPLQVSQLTVYNYMANASYNWGAKDGKVRPFIFGGVGGTQYSFGDLLLTPPSADRGPGHIDGETRFSTNWGGGIKFYPSTNVGIKAGVRWTPTFIKSDPAGVWCDPFYGCWELANAKYSNQFETAIGLAFRFH